MEAAPSSGMDIHSVIGPVAELWNQERLEECISAAQAGRKEVSDPLALGWLYYYEYKCLFELERHGEAFSLFNEMISGGRPLVFTANNAIWIHSVAMELAYRLRDKEALLAINDRAERVARSFPDRLSLIRTNKQVFLARLERLGVS